jgi:hypothetical protein
VTQKISESDAVAMMQIYELLAGMSTEVRRLLTLAKKPSTSLDDLENESDRLHELASSYQLALVERGEYDE